MYINGLYGLCYRRIMSDKSPYDTTVGKLTGNLAELQDMARKRNIEGHKKDAEIARLTDEAREKESKLRASRREVKERDAVIKDKEAEIGRADLEVRNAKAKATRSDAENRDKEFRLGRLTTEVAQQGTQIIRLTADVNRLTADNHNKDDVIQDCRIEIRYHEERFDGCPVCMVAYNGEMQFLDCHHGVCTNCLGGLRGHQFNPRCPKCRRFIRNPVSRTWFVNP